MSSGLQDDAWIKLLCSPIDQITGVCCLEPNNTAPVPALRERPTPRATRLGVTREPLRPRPRHRTGVTPSTALPLRCWDSRLGKGAISQPEDAGDGAAVPLSEASLESCPSQSPAVCSFVHSACSSGGRWEPRRKSRPAGP